MKKHISAIFYAILILAVFISVCGCARDANTIDDASQTTQETSFQATPGESSKIELKRGTKLEDYTLMQYNMTESVTSSIFEINSYLHKQTEEYQNEDAPKKKTIKVQNVTYELDYSHSVYVLSLNKDVDKYILEKPDDAGVIQCIASAFYEKNTDRVIRIVVNDIEFDLSKVTEKEYKQKAIDLISEYSDMDVSNFKYRTQTFLVREKPNETRFTTEEGLLLDPAENERICDYEFIFDDVRDGYATPNNATVYFKTNGLLIDICNVEELKDDFDEVVKGFESFEDELCEIIRSNMKETSEIYKNRDDLELKIGMPVVLAIEDKACILFAAIFVDEAGELEFSRQFLLIPN